METQTEQSLGRIEVAPEVITTIVRKVTQSSAGVQKMGTPPAGRFFSRSTRQEGVVLRYENGKFLFDVYVLMDPHGNIREASRELQIAITEALDQMVGIPVEAVNIHVEDVSYSIDEVV